MRAAATATASLAMLLGTIGEPARADDGQALAPFLPQHFAVDRDAVTTLGDFSLDDWRMRRAEHCLQVDELPTNGGENFFHQLRGLLTQTPLANQLYHDLSGSDVTVCHGNVVAMAELRPVYMASYDAIILPVARDVGKFFVSASEELRHAWQDQHGMISNDTVQNRQAYMAETFMVEADGATFAIATAYQLREVGEARAWDYLVQNPTYSQMANAFERTLTEGAAANADGAPTTANWQDAMRASYAAWFETETLEDIYTDRATVLLADMAHADRNAAYEIAVLGERLEGLQTATRPDTYLGEEQVAIAVNAAFDRFPPPALQQGFRPAATGPASGPE